MNIALIELTKIQFKSFFREPGIVFWALIFPILISWVLGIAFNSKRDQVFKVNIVDHGHLSIQNFFINVSQPVKLAVDIMNGSQGIFVKSTEPEALAALRKGEISLYIVASKDSVQFHYDPQNQEAKNIHLLLEHELRSKEKRSFLRTGVVKIISKGNRYIDFLIPGLIAFGIMNSCLWGISYNLIDFRMKKLLRRMVATPMSKSDFLLSVILARVVLCAIETLFLTTFTYFYFGSSLTGSVLGFIIVFLSGIGIFAGLSIAISSRAKSSQVGNGIINAVTLPMTILSGVFFNYHNFPSWAVKIISYLPLTMLADSIRGLYNEGYTIQTILWPSAIMLAIGGVLFITGIRFYKWY